MSSDRPNILFIMDDQHRHDYLGCAGAPWVRTPHLNRLAERGTRFTQCCTNSPVCVPARIALASGLQPSRLGALDNNAYLPAGTPTYYKHLRDHGYLVGCVGKIDLAKPDFYNGRNGQRPCAYTFGFTHPIECEGKMHAGQFANPQGPYGFWLAEQGLYEPFHRDYLERAKGGWALQAHDSVLPADAYQDVYVGLRAVQWLEENTADFPWHLFVSFAGPHDPFDPPSPYAQRYRDARMPEAIAFHTDDKPAYLQRRAKSHDPAVVQQTRRQYCAAIEVIDEQIGRILLALDRLGQGERTIVIFASDHGEMLGDHGCYTKSIPYESALRVPLILAGPGIDAGRVCHELVELIDLNATMTELAGLPAQVGLDARSLGPILRDSRAGHRSEIVSEFRGFRLIRTATHKLIENNQDISELYDLELDPHEQHNLAARKPEVCRQLRQRLRERYLEGKWMR